MFRYLTDLTKVTIFYVLAFSFSAALVPLAPVVGEKTPVIAMLSLWTST
jgi:hypothetical protein